MKISKKEYEQAKFVFQYYLDNTHGLINDTYYKSPQIGLSLIYDEGMDFVNDWMEVFPGRGKDTEEKAKARLSKFLKKLVDDGWMKRAIRPNYIEYYGEGGTWQYCYWLEDWLINELKFGRSTVEEEASKYTGYKND